MNYSLDGRRRRVFSRQLGLAVVACLFLSACGPSTSVEGEPALGEIGIITSPEQIALPVYEYLPTVEQTVALLFADQDMMNECFRLSGSSKQVQLGYRYLIDHVLGGFQVATVSAMTTIVSNMREEARTYGSLWSFFNPGTVAQYGYDRPPERLALSAMTDIEDPVVEACEAGVGALTPSGHVMATFSISSLPDGGPVIPSSDSRIVEAEKSWSSCMADQGLDYASPVDAIGANYIADTDAAKALARTVAVADVQCKIETNLIGVAVAVQTAYDQQYIDSHRDELNRLADRIADYLAGRVEVPTAPPEALEPSSTPS